MKLEKLFDYQKFENNSALGEIIDDVENKYYSSTVRELSLDEIDYVAAAGAKAYKELCNEEKDN